MQTSALEKVGDRLQTRPGLDHVTFEVLRNLFEYTCDRMTTVLQRASFSPILSDMVDFSNAIYDPEMRLLSQAANVPVHLAAFGLLPGLKQRVQTSGKDGEDGPAFRLKALIEYFTETACYRLTVGRLEEEVPLVRRLALEATG